MGVRKTFQFLAVFSVCSSIFPCSLFAAGDIAPEIQQIEEEMLVSGSYGPALDRLRYLLGRGHDARVLTNTGLAYYGMMRYEKAERYFKEAALRNSSVQYRQMLSWVNERVEENSGLLKEIEELEKQKAVNAEQQMAAIHYSLVISMIKEGKFYPSLVVPHIIWLKENMPDLPGLYEISGEIYYSAMQYQKAAGDLEKVLESDPGNIQVNKLLGDCFAVIGKYEEAERSYNRVIELYEKKGYGEDSPEVKEIMNIKKAFPETYNKAAELIRAGRYEEAERLCRKRLSLNAGDHTAMVQLGQVYWERGGRKQAIGIFRKAVRRAPSYPSGYFFLGKAYFFERKPDKGIAFFDDFIEKMDNLAERDRATNEFYVEALHYISHMYSTWKEKEKALEICEKIIRIDPEDQRAYYNLAVLYYSDRQNRVKAYNLLQRVIEIDPGDKTADMARFFIEYMRRNPDARAISDFTFIYEN